MLKCLVLSAWLFHVITDCSGQSSVVPASSAPVAPQLTRRAGRHLVKDRRPLGEQDRPPRLRSAHVELESGVLSLGHTVALVSSDGWIAVFSRRTLRSMLKFL